MSVLWLTSASRILTATGPGSSARARYASSRSPQARRGGVGTPSAASSVLAWSSSSGPSGLTRWAAGTRTGCFVHEPGAGVLDQGADRGGEGGRAGQDGHAEPPQRVTLRPDLLRRAAESDHERAGFRGRHRGRKVEDVRLAERIRAHQRRSPGRRPRSAVPPRRSRQAGPCRPGWPGRSAAEAARPGRVPWPATAPARRRPAPRSPSACSSPGPACAVTTPTPGSRGRPQAQGGQRGDGVDELPLVVHEDGARVPERRAGRAPRRGQCAGVRPGEVGDVVPADDERDDRLAGGKFA